MDLPTGGCCSPGPRPGSAGPVEVATPEAAGLTESTGRTGAVRVADADGAEAPARFADTADAADTADGRRRAAPAPELLALPGGRFRMGNDDAHAVPGDGEGPVRAVDVLPFAIAAHPVTTAEFAAFVAATGHRTLAEREGWSFVFAGLLATDHPPTRAVAAAPWWRQVHGADWAHPEGPASDLRDRADHPVVHVCVADALAYGAWSGTRLPTEAEWEYAARGGIDGARYPWGDELYPDGRHRCNIWQGTFPDEDTGQDGWRGTSPVDAFPANAFGLHDTSGNVWEWTADPFLAGTADRARAPRAMRGGSYLCHDSYCDRYRVAARTANAPDATSGHLGFRVAADG